MNDELREEIIEDLGLKWCAVINDYVHRECFYHCQSCDEYILMMNYYSSDDSSDCSFDDLE